MTRAVQIEGSVALAQKGMGRPGRRSLLLLGARMVAPEAQETCTRYSDRSTSWQSRLLGMTGSVAICAILLGMAFISWKVAEHLNVRSARLVVMDIAPIAAPPEPVQEIATGPQQIRREKLQQSAEPEPVHPASIIQLPIVVAPTAKQRESVIELVDPGPPAPETTAPRNIVAPTANRATSNMQANWESQILAHLERFRRYPPRARAARKQGTAYIRFSMSRGGMVLSAAIAVKSGSIDLDNAALDTLNRAQPLPAIPQDRPDIVELTIPVEYYLR